jgi:hypothetical protein
MNRNLVYSSRWVRKFNIGGAHVAGTRYFPQERTAQLPSEGGRLARGNAEEGYELARIPLDESVLNRRGP